MCEEGRQDDVRTGCTGTQTVPQSVQAIRSNEHLLLKVGSELDNTANAVTRRVPCGLVHAHLHLGIACVLHAAIVGIHPAIHAQCASHAQHTVWACISEEAT